MFSRASSLALFAATLGVVSAQLSISSQCENALTGLLTDSNAACLNPSGLISLATVGNNSLVGPIDGWLKGVCNQAPCTNASLASITNNLATNCQPELASFGVDMSAADLTTLVQTAYPSVREIACSQDTTNNTLCPTEVLTNLQNSVTGPLTISNVEQLVGQYASSPPTIPKSVECTDCTKQWYNIVKASPLDLINSSAESTVSDTCGADFVNGETPSDVKAFGTSGSASADNNAASASYGSSAIYALAMLSSAFIALA